MGFFNRFSWLLWWLRTMLIAILLKKASLPDHDNLHRISPRPDSPTGLSWPPTPGESRPLVNGRFVQYHHHNHCHHHHCYLHHRRNQCFHYCHLRRYRVINYSITNTIIIVILLTTITTAIITIIIPSLKSTTTPTATGARKRNSSVGLWSSTAPSLIPIQRGLRIAPGIQNVNVNDPLWYSPLC